MIRRIPAMKSATKTAKKMTSSEFIEKLKDDFGLDGKMASKRMLAQIEQDVDELKKRAIDLCPGQDYEDGFLSALTILKQNNSTYKKELNA